MLGGGDLLFAGIPHWLPLNISSFLDISLEHSQFKTEDVAWTLIHMICWVLALLHGYHQVQIRTLGAL